ncbi:hypothetical protein GNF86_01315 [Clostridium perfringens]
MENIFITGLENERKRIRANQGNWGAGTRNRLVDLLEENNVYVTDSEFDLLLFNIKDLYLTNNELSLVWRKNANGKEAVSKKVLKILRNNLELIKRNYNYIMNIN